MIKFDVVNPAVNEGPKNVLYLNQSNTLQFVFSVDAGATQFNPGDTIVAEVDSGLLTNAGAVQLHSNGDWDYAHQSLADKDVFTFTAHQNVGINPNKQCILSLSGFQPGSLSNNFVFNTKYQQDGRRESGGAVPMLIFNPPGSLRDLNSVIKFNTFINDDQSSDQPKLEEGIIYLSSSDLEPPIANSIHLNIAYSGEQLATGWENPDTPQITVFFTYGFGDSALTDDIQSDDANPPQPYNALTSAWNIMAELTGDSAPYWTLQTPDQNTGRAYPAWIITPKPDNQDLFTNALPNLDLVFTGVISRLPAGTALLYVQWNNIPGYFGSATVLPLSKQIGETKVLAFNSPQNNQTIKPGDPVTLSWAVFGGKQVLVSRDNGLRTQTFKAYNELAPALTYTGSTTIVPDSSENDCVIALDGVAANQFEVKVIVSNFPPPEITTFGGALTKLDDDSLVVQLDILVNNLGNKGIFDINGVQYDAGNYNGFPFQLRLPSEGMQFPKTFTLTAIDGETQPNKRSSSTISVDLPDWIKPQIKVFTASLQKDAGGHFGSVDIEVEVANNYAFSTIAFNDTPIAVDQTGKYSVQLPINDANPLRSNYTLVFTNPFAPAVSKTWALQFTHTKSIPDSNGMGSPTALAIRTQSQELYVVFSRGLLQSTIKKCPLDNPGAWDAGVQLSSNVELVNRFVIAPDGTQAILSIRNSNFGNPQIAVVPYAETQFSNQVYYNANWPYIQLPAVYAPDMRLVFFCVGNNKNEESGLYYTVPKNLNNVSWDNISQVSTNGGPVTDVAISADVSALYCGFEESVGVEVLKTNDLSVVGKWLYSNYGGLSMLTPAAKGQVYCLGGNCICGFHPDNDVQAQLLVRVYFNEGPVRLRIAAGDAFLAVNDYLNLYIYTFENNDPFKLNTPQQITVPNAGTYGGQKDVVISPDNTRIFVLTGGTLEVFEAQLV